MWAMVEVVALTQFSTLLPKSSENVPQVASAPTTQTISRGASDTSSDEESPLKAPPPVLKTPTTVLKTALKQPPPPSPTTTQAPDSEGFQTQQPRRRVQAKTKQKQNKKKTKPSKKSGGALQPICSIISPSRYAKDSSSSSSNSPNTSTSQSGTPSDPDHNPYGVLADYSDEDITQDFRRAKSD